MVRLCFDDLPACLRSGWPFMFHVLTLNAEEELDSGFEDYINVELLQGGGRLIGSLDELASGGQADFLSVIYEGFGPIRLRASVGADLVDSNLIPVERNADELLAEAQFQGGSTEVEMWLTAVDKILSQDGKTSLAAAEINDWMLLGGKLAAESAAHDNPQCISHILNCCEPWCPDGPNMKNLHYAGIEAYDEPGYRLLDEHYTHQVRPFLDSVRSSHGRCLVHCAMGVNRSAAICAAYLIEAVQMDLLPAIHLLKEKRGCVLGNRSFRLQLIEFAAKHERLGIIVP